MKLFVYGTLKNDLHKKIKCDYIGPATTTKKYVVIHDSMFGFPYLLKEKGKGSFIKGELYKVNEEALTFLDAFEGTPTMYKRGYIKLKKFGKAYVYYGVDTGFHGEILEKEKENFIKENKEYYDFQY